MSSRHSASPIVSNAIVVGTPKLPKCRLYHELSELKNKSGCSNFARRYFFRNENQLDCAEKVKEMIKTEKLHFNIDEEVEFLKILRFLRARKFNVEQTMVMIRADIKWRSEDDRLSLRQMTAFEVLRCDLSLVYKYFPTWIQGFDKQNRPISWRKFGQFEIWNILKLTSMQQLINFHAWESEQLLRLMHDKSKETGSNIETFTVVVDASGWAISQATGDAFTFIKGMISTDGNHYPERLGTLVVINAPAMLSWTWKVIQGFLDDVQKAKIGIYGTDPNEWRPVLFKIIDKDQVPVSYGGELPDLAQAEALSSMNPPPRDGKEDDKTQSSSIALYKQPNKEKINSDISLSDKVVSEKQKDATPPSTAYTPSKKAIMKAGWFGILDSSVSCINDVPTSYVDNDQNNVSLEVDVESSFNPNGDENSRQPLSDVITQQHISPLESPLRRIQHVQPTWNVDSSTQTGSSLKLNGRRRRVPLSKTCKLCVLM